MDLLAMKPSKKKPTAGDVFVIQPSEGIFFYGRVIRTNIPSPDPMIDGWNLIYLYQGASFDGETIPKDLAKREFLIPPKIVNNQGWLKGYFLTIGTLPAITEDGKRNFGFWDIVKKQFVDIEGKPLGKEPAIYGDYGLGSYGSVSYDVKRVLVARPELLNPIK